MSSLFNKNFWILTLMGISSGLPLSLTGGTLQAWLRSSNVDLTTIGLLALVGLPYTWKFLWSPIMDRFALFKAGRRRSWMLVSQVGLVLALGVMSFMNPEQDLTWISILALLTAFSSATQDIAMDAWRREQLAPNEFGWGNGIHVAGYLFAMRMVSGAFALILSDFINWGTVYQLMAGIQAVGIAATLMASEKEMEFAPPKTLHEAFWGPLKEFFQRPSAWYVLIFILLYKAGDNMAAHMSMPFYLDLGFSRTEVGSVTKVVGWIGIAAGSLLGGFALRKISVVSGLLWFGILQMVSTYGFAIMASLPKSIEILTAVIAFENFAAGLGTAAFVTFIGLMTNRQFTATQYALLSSLMGIPRIFLAAPTGYMAEGMGWFAFFSLCTFIAIPGLLMIGLIKRIFDLKQNE